VLLGACGDSFLSFPAGSSSGQGGANSTTTASTSSSGEGGQPGGGSGGISNGGTGPMGGSGGAALECKLDSECPNPPELCIEPKCEDGTCSTKPTAEGTLLPESEQKAGDCKKAVCDGEGGTTKKNDDSDPSSDNKECTSDGCKNGSANYEPLPAGTNCSEDGGTYCNGKGSCVDCLVNSDCGQVLYDCKGYICNDKSNCELVNFPSGTPANVQMIGDCQTLLCDAYGNTFPHADPNDVPIDPDPLDCLVPYCGAGGASQKKLNNGTPCGNGQQLCCIGICCPLGQKCDSNGNGCST